jgi:hypothetical protein
MAGFHVHLRAVSLAASLGAAFLVGSSCTCSERVLGDDPEGYGEPACMWLINPRAYYADGSSRMIIDRENNRSPTVCLCLTQEEYDSFGVPGHRFEIVRFPEEGTLLEEYNELGYDECKRLAGLIEGVVDDECLEYYEGGKWLKDIYWARGQDANAKPPGFSCIEP